MTVLLSALPMSCLALPMQHSAMPCQGLCHQQLEHHTHVATPCRSACMGAGSYMSQPTQPRESRPALQPPLAWLHCAQQHLQALRKAPPDCLPQPQTPTSREIPGLFYMCSTLIKSASVVQSVPGPAAFPSPADKLLLLPLPCKSTLTGPP